MAWRISNSRIERIEDGQVTFRYRDNHRNKSMLVARTVMTLPKISIAIAAAALIFRDAWRAVVRAPRPAGFVILILSVGIAATSVTFSIVDAVMLKPLPYEDSDELVRVRGRNPAGTTTGLSREEFWDLQNHARGFDSLGVVRFGTSVEVRVGDVAHRGEVAYATTGYIHALRLAPILGRLWTPEEESQGGSNIAAIGYDFWRHRLGADPDVLGRLVEVGTNRYRIIGVMSQKAVRVDGTPVAVWLPNPEVSKKATSSETRDFYPVGRIRHGVALSELQAQASTALTLYMLERPAADRNWKVELRRFDSELLGEAETWLLPVFATVLSLLLITCVNAANVLLARSSYRAGEFAVRASLGASRTVLILTVLVESILLSIAACVVALALSSWGIGAIKPLLPRMFRSNGIAFDIRVFFASLFAAITTGAVCGILPAWRASRPSALMLPGGSRSINAVRTRWHETFLICEIASVALVLTVSTLFVESFVRVISKDLGFEGSKLLAVSTVTKYEGAISDVTQRFATIHGVVGVAAVTGGMPPLVGDAFGGAHAESPLQRSDGQTNAPTISADTYAVSPNYFEVAGISFLRGSTWDADTTGGVMVIDDVTARGLFGDRDPVGQPVLARKLRDQVFTIIGLIPRQFSRGPEQERPSAYIALRPDARPVWVGFLLRTSPPPASLVRAVEQTSAAIGPPNPSPGAGVHVVTDAFHRLTAKRRFTAELMLALGIVATVIGAAGMYAVISWTVTQQLRDIAIRLALGATPNAIRFAVLVRSVQLLATGLAIGLSAGWGLSRVFTSMLFMVSGADPFVYGIVAGILSVVGVGAAMGPAWHASRLDPNKVLQQS